MLSIMNEGLFGDRKKNPHCIRVARATVNDLLGCTACSLCVAGIVSPYADGGYHFFSNFSELASVLTISLLCDGSQ